jgi:hypothetical protein
MPLPPSRSFLFCILHHDDDFGFVLLHRSVFIFCLPLSHPFSASPSTLRCGRCSTGRKGGNDNVSYHIGHALGGGCSHPSHMSLSADSADVDRLVGRTYESEMGRRVCKCFSNNVRECKVHMIRGTKRLWGGGGTRIALLDKRTQIRRRRVGVIRVAGIVVQRR